MRPATPGEGRSPDASDDAPAAPRFVTFADVAAEARRRIAAPPSQRVSFPWHSDADLDRMVARFRRLAAELALAPLGDACLVDESAAYPDAGRRDFALTNDRGAALYEYSHWVGGSPGDALLARFVLLLEDGASVDVTVVDSCTQERSTSTCARRPSASRRSPARSRRRWRRSRASPRTGCAAERRRVAVARDAVGAPRRS